MFTKPIPPEIAKQLAKLNAEVEAAVKARTAFLDSHMAEVSYVQVGDPLYNSQTGALVGHVTELYRYWQNRDWKYDNTLTVEARFRHPVHENYIDNTSRQPFKVTWRKPR